MSTAVEYSPVKIYYIILFLNHLVKNLGHPVLGLFNKLFVNFNF